MGSVPRLSLALFLIVCGIIGPGPLVGNGFSAAAATAAQSNAATTTATATASPDLPTAVGAAVGVPAESLLISIIAQIDSWAYGTAVLPAAPAGGESEEPGVHFFLASQTAAGWVASIRFTDAFDLMLADAPPTFPTPEIRASIDPSSSFTAAGDDSSQLSLPFPVGETWYFQGPHGYNGLWDALDIAPKDFATNIDASGGRVLAMRGGIAYNPCEGMVTIDHGDGWTTGYYHISSISVTNGQAVSRGTQVGVTDDLYTCGGYASTAHVHVWVEYRGKAVAIGGRDIGGWTVENGPDIYFGCLVRGTDRRCRNPDGIWNNYVTNGGEIGSGGKAELTLKAASGEVGGSIDYAITAYPANAPVAITWRRPGGSTVDLGTVTTNASGNATGSFTIPATTVGTQNAVRFTSGSSQRLTYVDVFPSLTSTPSAASVGDTVSVTLAGFAKQAAVTLAFIADQSGAQTSLGSLTTNNTGGGTKSVVLPAGLAAGPGQITAIVASEFVTEDALQIVTGATVWSPAMPARAGEPFTVQFAKFPANQPVTITVENPTTDAVVGQIGAFPADATGFGGGQATPLTIPSGQWRLKATSGAITAVANLSVGPTLTLPATAQRGQSVTVTGKGFAANGTVTVSWMTDQGNTSLGTGQADSMGTVSVAITAPSIPDGNISLLGADGQNNSVFTGLTIAGGPVAGTPTATVTPVRSTVNTKVSYSLSGFPANATVKIDWKRVTGSVIALGEVVTNASGTASGQITVPATPGGTGNAVRFTAGSVSATTPFEVAPRIKVTPATAAVGATIDVSLRGFARQEVVRIRWKKGTSWVQVAQVTTSNTGSTNVAVVVPAWAANGANSVRADGTTFSAQTNAVTVTGGANLRASEALPATPTADATPIATETPTVVPETTPTESGESTPVAPTPSPEQIDPTAVPTETPEPVTTPIAIVADVSSDQSGLGWAAHDGDPSTAWQVAAPAPDAGAVENADSPADPPLGPDGLPLPAASLVLDLGAWVPIGAVRWMFAVEGGADHLRIEVSDDGVTWTALTAPGQIGNFTPLTWQELPLAPGSVGGRYVRFAIENPNGDATLGGLVEVEIWP